MAHYYIGLISGTSMDGVDAVLTELSKDACVTVDFLTLPYAQDLLEELKSLCQPGANEINRTAVADRRVALHFADAVKQLLQRNGLTNQDVRLVGSHGQTIRHHPTEDMGFTLQIGDPNTIAAETEIDVVADFRRKDIALGGQGAPLVPAFHHAIFASEEEHRVILNIGGIANISYLPKASDVESLLGFDTGPGNRLLDAWCKVHTEQEYDKDGLWAKSGEVHEPLLKSLLTLEYFSTKGPKSTGREQFNLEWLQQLLQVQPDKIPAQDVQATLLELTVQTIAAQIKALPDVDCVYVCGGGVHNQFMMNRLQKTLTEMRVTTTHDLGIDPDAVEALAFAWLGYAFANNIPGNVIKVTGASRKAVLGSLSKYK